MSTDDRMPSDLEEGVRHLEAQYDELRRSIAELQENMELMSNGLMEFFESYA